MIFIEPPTFTRMVKELLADEDYRALQNLLLADPPCGDPIGQRLSDVTSELALRGFATDSSLSLGHALNPTTTVKS